MYVVNWHHSGSVRQGRRPAREFFRDRVNVWAEDKRISFAHNHRIVNRIFYHLFGFGSLVRKTEQVFNEEY